MEDITSKKGEAHVTSTQFRAILESLAGVESYIASIYDELEPELSTNNTVIIRPGILIHHGHVIQVPPNTYDTVNYLNGTQGMKRIDLVVARYTRNTDTGNENTDWVVIQGEPDATAPVVPDYTMGNMQEGDLVDDCPVFELHFDGINVTSVEKVLETFAPINDIADKIYPVGTVYKNTKDVNPNKLFGGVWEPIEDVFLIGAGGKYTVNARGGAESVSYTPKGTNAETALTNDQMPAHVHKVQQGVYNVGPGSGATVLTYQAGTNGSGTTSVGAGKKHGHAFTGTKENIATMPPYRGVYFWERIA